MRGASKRPSAGVLKRVCFHAEAMRSGIKFGPYRCSVAGMLSPSNGAHVIRIAPLARILRAVAIAVLLVIHGVAYGQSGASVRGTVASAHGGAAIAGANVAVFEAGSRHVRSAVTTDAGGRYRVAGLAPGIYRLEVRASGYRAARRCATLRAGRAEALHLVLDTAASRAEPTVPASSRPREAACRAPTRDAPVVQPPARRPAVVTSSVGLLRSMAGVNLTQTGMDRRTVALRGINDTFSSDPLVLVDDRPAGLPALGANVYALMPIQPVDLKRVDVVRGPAAAQYGPGAAGGVLHFITKDPFDDPGTTVDVAGGQRQFVRGQFRHADDIGGTFGYEVTAHAARGTDWSLDSAHPTDRPWLARDYVFDDPERRRANQIVDAATGQLLRDPNYWKAGVRGRFAYRLGRETTIALQGGYASLTGQLRSELGALQASFLGYSFGQVRVQSGGLLAQAMLNNNEAGASYVYGTGQSFVDRGVAYGTQLRYRFDVPRWATVFTVGTDARWTRPRTKHTLMGRHEAHDGVDRYGVYGEGHTALSTRLDAALALRADIDNLGATVWPAMHAALSYALTPERAVHLRYERAAAEATARRHFLDMNTRRRTLAGPYDFVHRVQGATDGFTFDRYRRRGRATSLIPSAGRFGRPLRPEAISLQALYETTASRFERLLSDPATRPEAVERLSASQTRTLAAALRELVNGFGPQDRTEGTLGVPHGGADYRAVGPPEDIAPLARPIVQSVEVGYRGRIGPPVRVAATMYVRSTKNAVRPAEMVTPLVYAARLEEDLASTLGPLIAQAASASGAPLSTLLDAMDVTPSEAARLTAQLVGQAYEGVPVGVVRPDQAVLPAGASAVEHGALITYRNEARMRYVGADVSIQADIHRRVDAVGTLSVRQPSRLGQSPSRSAADALLLNGPRVKAHLGVNVDVAAGWTLHAAGHYASRFPVRAGLYAGTVSAAHPLDVGVHYDAKRYAPGLEVHLTVRNVLNQRHRAFVGAPAMGRMALARITYAL